MHSKLDESFLNSINYMFELVNQAYELFEKANIEQKRKLIIWYFRT